MKPAPSYPWSSQYASPPPSSSSSPSQKISFIQYASVSSQSRPQPPASHVAQSAQSDAHHSPSYEYEYEPPPAVADALGAYAKRMSAE